MATTTDDFPNTISTTGKLVAGVTAHANFEKADDSDWFKVHLAAGTSYRFTVTADDAAFQSTIYGISTHIMKPDGFLAAGNFSFGDVYSTGALSIMGFTPIVSGDYYFSTVAGGSTGRYAITLSTDKHSYVDDAPDTVGTAKPLPLDTVKQGTVDGSGDIDVYSLDLVAGIPYTITLAKPAGSYMRMALVDNNGVNAGSSYKEASSQTFYYTGGTSGKLSVAVYGGYDDIGAYQLRASPTASYDGFSGDIYTSGQLWRTSISGSLEQAGASDWVWVWLSAGERYALELYSAASSGNTLGAGGTAIPKLSLMDANGKVVASAVGGGTGGDPRIEFTVPASGGGASYFLSASDQLGKGTGSYTMAVHTVPSTAAGDLSNDPTKPVTLNEGAVVDSRIEVDDVDYFGVKLSAGVTYDFDVTPPAGVTDATVLTTLARREDADPGNGQLAATTWTKDGHQHVVYKPATSGYYVLGVNYVNAAGAYRLAFGPSARQDDVGDTPATATGLTVGAGASKGTIAPYQDVDVYRVHLEQGQGYDFYLDDGYLSNDNILFGSQLQLLDAKGEVIGEPGVRIGTRISHLDYTAATGGDYYLAVSATSTRGGGDYSISAERADGSAVAAPRLTQDQYLVTSATGVVPLAGTAAAGDKVLFYAGGELIGSTVADADGAFRVEQHLPDGSYDIYAVASNAAGKLSLPGNSVWVLLDSIVPAAPVIGAAAVDDNTVTLSGTAEARQVVTIWADGVGLAEVWSDGSWSAVVTLKNGAYDLSATATDLVNISPASAPWPVRLGTVVLAAPTLQTVQDQHLFASSQLLLSGSADAGTRVEVTSAGKVLASAMADAAGHWSASTGALTDGHYALTARVSDAHGYGSAPSATFSVDIDTTAPAVPTVRAAHGADGATLGPRPVLTGDAEAGASIAILRDGALQGHVVADLDGHWQWRSGELANGGYAFAVRASDAAGNSSAGSAVLAVQVKTGAAQLGGAGADTIALAAGSHVVDGGAGLDTVVVDGAAGAYTASADAEGWVLAAHDEGGATALLVDVERIRFSDGALAYDFESGVTGAGVAGQAYRLYQAAFARQPDQAGLGYWIAQMDKGVSLHNVADSFVHSAEYTSLYGAAPTSAELVTHLYRNVLHREPEAAGAAYWIDMLAHGVGAADVLGGFSESAENQAQLIGAMKNGIAYIPYS